MSEVIVTPDLEIPEPDPRAGRYVIFRLAHGEFGIAVQKVREVLEMLEITVVPNAPAFIAGVMNLRGKVIPAIDLRRTFELPCASPAARSCIMVVRATLASTEQVFGIVVDEVLEVLTLQAADFLEPEAFATASEFGIRHPAPYLIGVARTDDKVKLLIDIDEVLNNVDLHHTSEMAAAA